MNIYSKHGKVLDELLDNPDDWILTENKRWMIHDSGIRVWVIGGSPFFNGDTEQWYPAPYLKLNCIERFPLYFKAKKIIRYYNNKNKLEQNVKIETFINNCKNKRG